MSYSINRSSKVTGFQKSSEYRKPPGKLSAMNGHNRAICYISLQHRPSTCDFVSSRFNKKDILISVPLDSNLLVA